MEGKLPSAAAATTAPFYVEFEPFCQWQREEGRDVLVIHLPEFKKEHLRVQINSRGTLKISGERPVDSLKKSKFYKEVEVPKYCDANSIQAKFANGCLYVVMPKIPKISTEQANTKAAANQTDGSGVVASGDDGNQKKKSESTQTPVAVEKPSVSADPASISKKELTQQLPNIVESSPPDPKIVTAPAKQKGSAVSKMKICAKTSLNVAVAVAVLVALVSYVLYMYRSVVLED